MLRGKLSETTMTFRTIRGAHNGAVMGYTNAVGAHQWIHVAVQKDSDTGEYRARIMAPVHEKSAAADYFTDDKTDALMTSIAMAKAIWQRNAGK